MRWVLIFAVSCVGLLAFVYLAIWVFNGFHGIGLDLAGTIALTLGTIVAAGLGVALMGLVFYSDRNGYDKQAADAGNSADQLPH
jgi:hypothetical protein